MRYHSSLADLDAESVDVVYANGVLHHIEPKLRSETLERVARVVRPGGYAAIFENNPWNPGTRLCMALNPMDRAAIPISPRRLWHLVQSVRTLRPRQLRYLFFFPKPLARLRYFEPRLSWLALGAQYVCLADRVET